MVKVQNSCSFNRQNARKIKSVEASESISTGQQVEKSISSRFICKEVKQKFVELITKRNYSMKQAAKIVNMSYSTAKKIYRRFRAANLTRNTSKKDQCRIQAAYIQVPEGSITSIPIICLIAGNPQRQQ